MNIDTSKLNEHQLRELVNQLLEENREKDARIDQLSWNAAYGCYTREGFLREKWPQIAGTVKWIIYFDIDNMNKLNEKYGHSGVDARIKESLQVRGSDFVAGQRYSGDEIFVCITEDDSRDPVNADMFCERLKETFSKNGVPATFAVVEVTSTDLIENFERAVQLVEEAKKANGRGRIYFE
jgi:GGDEF domain-containing protein